MGDLSDQVVNGINQIRDWLRDGPLKITDSQLSTGLDQVQKKLSDMSSEAFATATEVGTAVGHLVAGLFIVLFATYFFLADGTMIWTWIVRIFPRAARTRADSSGRVAWRSLTQFVRATVMVAGDGCHRHHDRRRDPAGAVRERDRRPGVPRRVHPARRRLRLRNGRGAGRPGRPGTCHRPDHVRRRRARAADRGAHPAAVPDGPLRLRAPARRDHRDRARRDRGRDPRSADRRTTRRVAERGRAASRELHRGRGGSRGRQRGRSGADAGLGVGRAGRRRSRHRSRDGRETGTDGLTEAEAPPKEPPPGR